MSRFLLAVTLLALTLCQAGAQLNKGPKGTVEPDYPIAKPIGGLDYIIFNVDTDVSGSNAVQVTLTAYLENLDTSEVLDYATRSLDCNSVHVLTFQQSFSPPVGHDYRMWYTITFCNSAGDLVRSYTYGDWYVSVSPYEIDILFIGDSTDG